ncbi:MAG: hypothetical protein EBT69_08830, partial [Verrucomicrobia bacterium]|nr:hypothetical protein [Verrucomicrobiota bacterium]
ALSCSKSSDEYDFTLICIINLLLLFLVFCLLDTHNCGSLALNPIYIVYVNKIVNNILITNKYK